MDAEKMKEWLGQYHELDEYITELIREKEKWHNTSAIAAANATRERVSGGMNIDRVQTAVEKIFELEKKISTELDRLCDLRGQIGEQIVKLKDVRLRRIIFLKYVDGLTFEQIADQTGYCTRQVTRLHNTAIDMLSASSDKTGSNSVA